MTVRDLILRALTAPKQRGTHYAPDSAEQLLAEYDAQVAARIADLEMAARSAAVILRSAADRVTAVISLADRDRWNSAARALDDIARGTAARATEPGLCPPYLRRAVEPGGTVHAARYAGDRQHFTTACAAYPAPIVDRLEPTADRPVTCPGCLAVLADAEQLLAAWDAVHPAPTDHPEWRHLLEEIVHPDQTAALYALAARAGVAR